MNNENASKGIAKKYSRELSDIAYNLNQIEIGNIYELTGAKMDGYLATKVKKVRDQFADLLSKIENDSPSIDDELRKALSIYNDEK